MRLDRGIASEALMYLALAGMAVTHIIDARMKLEEQVYYMFGLFVCCILGALAIIAVIYLRPDKVKAWAAASLLALLTIGCYVYSRTAGFPQMEDHVGEWGSLLGNLSRC